jgi:DNA-directed RNA polymerase specialized sigma24 family protein
MEDFELWYQTQRPRVLAACMALASDLDAAREATDEAFTRALECWSTVRGMVSPGGWTQTVALNYLRRGLRRRRRERGGLGERPSVPPPAVPDTELWAAVRSLPHRQQTAVVLRYVHDLRYEEIATVMGISRGTVASTLAAARAGLTALLSEPEYLTEERIDG